MTRFVVCGEALIDLAAEDEDQGTDTFRSRWEALSAGGPMNTAVALARLGQPIDFCGRLSTDRFGRQLRSHLEANGVGLGRAVTSDQATSLAVVSLDGAGKASYVFHFADTANFGWLPHELPALVDADWLHVASLVTIVEPAATVLQPWVAAHGGPMSVDINVRPTVIADPHEYWRKVEPWLDLVGRRGGVFKASDDDVEFLARGAGEDGDPVEVLARWAHRFGASLAVCTLGPSGAVAVSSSGTVRRPGRLVDLVDTVGAGDTFMAGFLAAYAADPQDVAGALDRGIAASALVCGRQGAQPPTAEELDAAMRA